MCKELETLKEIKKQIGNIHYFDFNNDYPIETTIKLRDSDLFIIIERSLKALNIIRDKRVDVGAFQYLKTLKEYNEYIDMVGGKYLLEEEYDLLKEALLND